MHTPDLPPRLLTLKQAAGYCGVSLPTFRRLARTGSLPLVRLPSPHGQPGTLRRVLIDRLLLDTWISLHRTSQ